MFFWKSAKFTLKIRNILATWTLPVIYRTLNGKADGNTIEVGLMKNGLAGDRGRVELAAP